VPLQKAAQTPSQSANPKVNPAAPAAARTPGDHAVRRRVFASAQSNDAHIAQASAQTEANPMHAEAAQADAELASELIASRVTTQPRETVIAVLAASRDGASINAAAKALGINYRTAQRIVQAAVEQRQLLAAS
jgi:hypothetical protein